MTSMSAADLKNHFMQIFGADLGAKYDGLRDEVILVHAHWAMITEFVNGEERRKLLVSTGGYFFLEVHRVFVDDVILRLSRLTDPAQQGRGRQKNLSLYALLDDISDPSLKSKIQNLIEEAKKKIAPLREHRHKRIAHFDLNVAFNDPSFSLPSINGQSVDEALAAVGEVLGQLLDEYQGTSTIHEWVPIDAVPNIEGLLHYLEVGLDQEEPHRR